VLHRNSELGLEKEYFAYMNQGISVDYGIVSPAAHVDLLEGRPVHYAVSGSSFEIEGMPADKGSLAARMVGVPAVPTMAATRRSTRSAPVPAADRIGRHLYRIF
jgi:hypothetical protein